MTNNPASTAPLRPTKRMQIALLCIVATVSVVISADATHDEVLRLHVVTSSVLAWGIVIVFEGGALSFALLAQERVLKRKRAVVQRVWLAGLLLVAVTVNVLRARANGAPTIGCVIAGMFPVVLFGMLESAWRERTEDLAERHARAEAERARIEAEEARVRADQERAREKKERAEQRERARTERTSGAAPDDAPALSQARAVSPRMTVQEQIESARRWLAEDPGITGKEVADRLGVHAANGRKRLAEARALQSEGPAADPAEPAA